MGSWLTDKLMEGGAWSFPGSGLHSKEGGDGKRDRKTLCPANRWPSDEWSHEQIGQAPCSNRMSHELSRELLQLPMIQLFHPEHLVVRQVVIIDIREPVPVLCS